MMGKLETHSVKRAAASQLRRNLPLWCSGMMAWLYLFSVPLGVAAGLAARPFLPWVQR